MLLFTGTSLLLLLFLLFTGSSRLFHVVDVYRIILFIWCNCCCLQDLVVYFMMLLFTGSSPSFHVVVDQGPKLWSSRRVFPPALGSKRSNGQMSDINGSNVRDQTVKCQSTSISQLSDSNQSWINYKKTRDIAIELYIWVL